MLQLDYISTRGDALSLVNNPLFQLLHIDGHTAANTSIASAVVGGMDGDTVNNIQATPRTIIIDLQIRNGVDVEEAKRAILKVIKIKQRGVLKWTQNGRAVTITGVVEEINMPRWAKAAVMQITLHCEQPFWEDAYEILQQINEIINLQYFTTTADDMLYFTEDGVVLGEYDAIRTKTFHNAGDVAVGLEINIIAHDIVTNPIIYDQHGNYFGIGHEATAQDVFIMSRGDIVTISTHKGNKTVKFNGQVIYDKIRPRSKWLQLEAGDNTFTINSMDASETNMSFTLVYKQRYV